MSYVNKQNRSKYLAAIGKILHQLRCLVSTKLSSTDASTSIYSLYYDEDDDTNIGASTSSKDEEEVLDAPTCREGCVIGDPTCCEECVIDAQTCSEECVNDSSMSESVSSTTSATSEVMMTKVLAAISSLAPFSIYDKSRATRKRRKKVKKMISPELFSIWSHAATIVTPDNNSRKTVTNSYPSVDWRSVNKRFLTNIPTPVSIPIHGCSSNPDDYKDEFSKSDFGRMQNIGSKFDREFPFGKALGFFTDQGPINVPDHVFHGYIYQPDQGWLLHAEYPMRRELPMTKENMKSKRRKKRQRG